MNKQRFNDIVNGEYGRKIAYTSANEVTAENVLKIARIGINTMKSNRNVILYLDNYKKGDQPVLYRDKTVRDDVNNPTVENHAYELVQFEVGQTYGEPVQCVSLKNDEKINESVDKLNDFYRGADKQTVDIEVGEWVSTVGVGYKAVQKKNGEIPFRLISLDPAYTIIVKSKSTKEDLLSVEEYTDDDGKIFYHCFSASHEYLFTSEDINMADTISIPMSAFGKLHAFGAIPIVEYVNNADALSSIELIIGLLDGINEVQSDRIDSVDQIVQSYFKFVNCEIDETEFAKMKDLGAIVVKSNNGENKADVDIISQDLNQSQTQTLKDDIYENSLKILSIPGRQATSDGGSTTGAVSLRSGWDNAKLRAKTRDPFVVKSEKKIAMLVLNVLRLAKNDLKLGTMDFDINIVHSPTDNLLVKSEALEILLRSGIHPLVAIRVCGLWSDAEKTYMESKPYLDVLYKTIDEKIKELNLEAEVEKAKAVLVGNNQQNGNNTDNANADNGSNVNNRSKETASKAEAV